MVYLKNEGKNLPSPRFGTAVSAVKKKKHHVGAPHGQQMGGEGEPAHSPSRHAALFGDAILQS